MTSHVPHVLANVVVNQAGANRVEGHEPLAHAGGSLRDMTRVAGANPRIWVDIFLDNAEPVRAALAEHRRRIEQVEAALAQWRRRIPRALDRRGVGESPPHARARVPAAARCSSCACTSRTGPGVLAGITQALGAERINIEDFELHHVSPERGGTLIVLVAGEGEAQRAADILEAQGYSVVVSPVLEALMKIDPAASLDGHFAVPGDKSVSHRALLLGSGLGRRHGDPRLGTLRRHRIDARCGACTRRGGR